MWYILLLAVAFGNDCFAMCRMHAEDDGQTVIVYKDKPVIDNGVKMPHRQTALNLVMQYHKARSEDPDIELGLQEPRTSAAQKEFHASCITYLDRLKSLVPLEISQDSSQIMHAFGNKLVLIPIKRAAATHEAITAQEPMIIEAAQDVGFNAISVWYSHRRNRKKHYHVFAADGKKKLHAWSLYEGSDAVCDPVVGDIPGRVQAIRQMNTEVTAVFFKDEDAVTDRVGFLLQKWSPEITKEALCFIPINVQDVTHARYSECNLLINGVLTVFTRNFSWHYDKGFASDQDLKMILPGDPMWTPLDGCSIQ